MAVAVLVWLFASAGASAQDCSGVVKQRRLSSLKIEVEATVKSTGAIIGATGTGVVIADQGYVLTNSHVVNLGNDVEKVTITGRLGSSKAPAESLTLIDDDTTHDIALLKFSNSTTSPKPVPIGRIASAERGSALCSIGYPLDVEFHVSPGLLGGPSDLGGWWTLTIPTNPGESGAPVFDVQGRLLGLRVAGRVDLVGVYFMVPINLAARLLALVPTLNDPTNVENSLYAMQLNGQPAVVGRAFTVDLGTVEEGKAVSVPLAVRLVSGKRHVTVASAPAPLSVTSEAGGDFELTSDRPVNLTLRLDNPSVDGMQEREVRLLLPKDGTPDSGPPLTVTVRWRAMKGTVEVPASSGARASGRGQDFSPQYEVCANAPADGDYIVKSGTFSLTGDRACGAWSSCLPLVEERKYCMAFTLQGHDECLGPFSSCDPTRNSEGHVRAVFKLRPSTPRLIAVI
jgi:S1-C subfamily serine protease